MNRRWPLRGCWALLAVTMISAIVSVFTEAPRFITAAFAAATGFVWLCQRRHFQNVLSGATLTGMILGGFFAPDRPMSAIFSESMIACGVMAGCRGVAERALRGRPHSNGVRVLWLSSVIFGASVLAVFPGRIDGNDLEGSGWRLATLSFAAALVAALAQFVAAIFLVKTIPEAKQDERPAIALWIVLVVWMVVGPVR